MEIDVLLAQFSRPITFLFRRGALCTCVWPRLPCLFSPFPSLLSHHNKNVVLVGEAMAANFRFPNLRDATLHARPAKEYQSEYRHVCSVLLPPDPSHFAKICAVRIGMKLGVVVRATTGLSVV